MARKQTLKSLLGGSDSREQVSLDLGTPALQPTAQRAGQYRVAVQQTPKTNSALQLAQALRYTPQVLGQATNIAQKMGAEAAVNATDVEGEMLDDETKGILGYDKAYQQGLVKRHFSMNEEAIKTRFQNLASDAEFLKKDPDQFLAALGEERQRFNEELMDQFGGNGNREQAITALSSTFVDDILDATTSEWTDNKKQQTEMFISGDAQAMFATKGVAAGLSYQSTELAGLGMAPKEIAQAMRNSVIANAQLAVAAGRFQDASKTLAEGEAYKVGGKHSLFGSTKGIQDKVTLMNAIERGVKAAAREDDDEVADTFASISADAMAGLRGAENAEDVSPTQLKIMANAFEMVHPTKTPEEITTMVNEVFTGNGTPIQNFHTSIREGAVNGSDSVYDMYNDSRSKLDYQMERISSRPLSPLSMTPKKKDKAVEEFRAWHKNNPTKDDRDWIAATGQRFKRFEELSEASNEVNAGNYVRESLPFKNVRRDLSDMAGTISDTADVPFNDTLLTSLRGDIENLLLERAQEVAGEENSLELITKYREELFTSASERLNGLAAAYAQDIDPLSARKQEQINNTDTTVTSGRNEKTKYGSLKWGDNPFKPFTGRQVRRGQQAQQQQRFSEMRKEIEKDRETMLAKGHRSQLQLSLVRHGFTHYDPVNIAMLTQSGLDSGDVKLFANTQEVIRVSLQFGRVLEADTGLNTLTAEQKEIREQYQALGISNESDLKQFNDLQSSLLNQ